MPSPPFGTVLPSLSSTHRHLTWMFIPLRTPLVPCPANLTFVGPVLSASGDGLVGGTFTSYASQLQCTGVGTFFGAGSAVGAFSAAGSGFANLTQGVANGTGQYFSSTVSIVSTVIRSAALRHAYLRNVTAGRSVHSSAHWRLPGLPRPVHQRDRLAGLGMVTFSATSRARFVGKVQGTCPRACLRDRAAIAPRAGPPNFAAVG